MVVMVVVMVVMEQEEEKEEKGIGSDVEGYIIEFTAAVPSCDCARSRFSYCSLILILKSNC